MRRFGVDEAGKGPVLGSMFAAAVVAPPEALPDGVADSKTLAPARREELAADLREHPAVDVGVAEISVERIDDPETDMNTLTVEAHAEALDAVSEAVDGLGGTVDAGDVDAERFGRRVAEWVDADVEVEARHEADADDPHVAAASVVAKVERDAHVAALAEEYGEVGSGYPSDPTTREFLRTYVAEHGDLPDCARESWSTCADVLAAAEQSALDQF
ncbi:ribonuclease HII [Halospeciosus flavus]|uniref:Ribonuclease HII n=1 Tax=Halospeciosus flavus TaxID=3032283 RepID=A0ABD5Z826_9EURY|nr:ribonuclease HII [Halospeciosus flavus]